MKQYIPEVDVVEIIDFARLDPSNEEDRRIAESALHGAVSFVKNYTGLDVLSANLAFGSAPDEYELCEDLGYAVKAIAAEMIDNRQIAAQYTGKNPTVMQILDMHSTNLLPSC